MSELEDKLNSILSNPEMMAQIMNMAKAFGQTPGQEPPPEKTASSLPGFDPGMMQQIMHLAGSMSADKNQQALLLALQPYLSRDRISRLEKAMRAAKMAKVASEFLQGGGHV